MDDSDSKEKRYADRLQCIAYKKAGKSAPWIERELKRSRRWVYRHWNKTREECKDKDRAGRPRTLTAEARRVIRRRSNRIGKSNRVVSDEISTRIQNTSHSTVGRERKRMGIKPRRRPKVPPLTPRNIRDRAAFARGYGQWQAADWEKVLFVDETDFTLIDSSGNDWYWSDDDHKYEIPVKPTPHSQVHYKVFSGFTARGLLELHWYGKDVTMDSNFYCDYVLPYHIHNVKSRRRVTGNPTTTRLFEDLNDWWYLQDGATAHTARITQDLLSDIVPNFIYAQDWPGIYR